MGKALRVLQPEANKEQRGRNAALCWTAADILQADRDQLLTMQHRLGLGNQWGCIEFPKAFMPSGHGQYDSSRILLLTQFLPQGMAIDSIEANRAWTEILRFAVARLTLTGPRRATIQSYSTCAGNLTVTKPIVRVIMQCTVEEGYFWSRVGEEASAGKSKTSKAIFSTIRHYHRAGALPDTFRKSATIEADEPERDRYGEPDYEAPVEENKKWQPLPMEFVSQMGWRSLRLIKNIAPTLLDAIEAAVKVPDVTHRANGRELTKSSGRSQTLKSRDKVIVEWQWKDDSGQSVHDLGFDCRLQTGEAIIWPPRTFTQAMAIAHRLVKPAHLWMVLLGNGSRNSEVVSMRDDCLVQAHNGSCRWKGRTYKMAGITGGSEIDAVVPEIITQSILQQMRLASITKKNLGVEGSSLWVGQTVEGLKNLSEPLNSYVDFLGLRHLLGEDNPSCHEHRFRKTLAKIAALALTNATMILKDCFGHTDPAMTLLSYIIADPSIAQEVIKVQKELTIMMSIDVINNLETMGGPGALGLRQRADDYLKRIGKSKFEPQDTYEFARRETFDGRSWMMLSPGILCTAPHDVTQVSTPCAVGQRRHNPANCRTECEWQLLLKGYYVTQADDTVDYALKNLHRAIDADDEAMIAFWVGQAKAWLYRYDEVAEKWKDHPLVKQFVPQPKHVMLGAA